jgi:hypothetical protein
MILTAPHNALIAFIGEAALWLWIAMDFLIALERLAL